MASFQDVLLFHFRPDCEHRLGMARSERCEAFDFLERLQIEFFQFTVGVSASLDPAQKPCC